MRAFARMKIATPHAEVIWVLTRRSGNENILEWSFENGDRRIKFKGNTIVATRRISESEINRYLDKMSSLLWKGEY